MEFQEPVMLIAAAGIGIILIAVFRRFEKMRESVLTQFAANHLLRQLTENISDRKRWWKRLCFVVGIICLMVALARPQSGFRWQEVKRKGIISRPTPRRSARSSDICGPMKFSSNRLAISMLAT